MDFINIKQIKKLGTGSYGTTYLVEKDGKKYAMKVQHILPIHRKKTFQYELWRELDLYEYINTLNKDDIKFFNKLYAYKIYNNCKHIQNGKKSEWCIKYLLEYDVMGKIVVKVSN